ncbi:MAG: acyl-CoA dehydrogenase family protein [Thermodesulfobacteriota bacterium]
MSLPDRNNPYAFDEFLSWRNSFDYYADDPFLQKTVRFFCGPQFQEVDRQARECSQKVSFRWRDLADAAAAPEKQPYMVHYDGHNHRIDRIVRPLETLTLEREVFSEALFSQKTLAWTRVVKVFLLSQNSEACIICPIACTEGLVALLRKFADTPETKRILAHVAEGEGGTFGIGAQYLSEIQGGSDVPANLVEAVPDQGFYRLYGKKFFCSAAHADYAVITAKPAGSEKVAVFVTPSWLPGNKEKEIRNGYTIDRIKVKMGTRELPTAEINYDGAVAYPLGPLSRGLANVVGMVLTLSRLTLALAGGAGALRGAREARRYAAFRTAFGLRLADFPMLARQLDSLEHAAKRMTAGAFAMYDLFFALPDGVAGSLAQDEPLDLKRKRFLARELVMLQKIAAAWDATDLARLGMSVFGGHGVMEDFSVLPRMYRDGAVNELWEGPRNVLVTQMHRDFQRAADFYPVSDLVSDLLPGADPGLCARLAKEGAELVAYPSLVDPSPATGEVCERFDAWCSDLAHAFQDLSLSLVEAGKK